MNISDALFTVIGFFSLVFLVTIFYIKAYKTLCKNIVDSTYPTSPATSSEPVPQRGGVSGHTGHDNSLCSKIGDSITPDASCRVSGQNLCPADSIVTCSQSEQEGNNRRALGSSGSGTYE